MAQTFIVNSGTTSVSLDLPLLELAAGITLVSANTDGEAFSEEFQLGFPIIEDTDFSFETEPFAPVDGTINHSGTVTLNLNDTEVTVGDFLIGFDASRVSNTASGFFVSDTTEDALDLEILFDISAPGNVTTDEGLIISEANLLVASELANALGSSDLTGADIGDTRIDASTSNINEDIASDVVYRFLNNNNGVHFYTGNETERDVVLELPNFSFEGASYESIDPLTGNPEPSPVYRFFNQDTGVHLYTISEVERDFVDGNLDNFVFEGETFFAYPTEEEGTIPIYRFFNTTTGAHFYTPSVAERDNVEANLPDFLSEGVAYYTLPVEE
ncbi:MAG TPA: hypothetical protein V6C71_13430 [Coleofasciculaceae cyanobacterium]|jgi:hypothetical protein